MTHLHLLRHGQTTSNEIHALDTALPGASLTALGREQSTHAGQQLAGLGRTLHVASSQAARAQQTAAVFAASYATSSSGATGAGLESSAPDNRFGQAFSQAGGQGLSLIEDATATTEAGEYAAMLAQVPGVSEIPAGELEMKNDEDSHEHYHGLLGDWIHGRIDNVLPGGSTGAEVLASYLPQALALGAAAEQEDADVLLVSHGAVIRFIATWLGRVDPEFAYRMYLPNAQVVTLELPDNVGELAREYSTLPALEAAEAVWGSSSVTSWGDFGPPPLG